MIFSYIEMFVDRLFDWKLHRFLNNLSANLQQENLQYKNANVTEIQGDVINYSPLPATFAFNSVNIKPICGPVLIK